MSDTKISALTELAETPASGDLVPVVDISDTTMAASGTDKKVQFTNFTTLKSKIITSTRDMTAVSGDVGYSGVGFTPTAIICIGCISGAMPSSIGFSDSGKTVKSDSTYSDTFTYDKTSLITIFSSVGNYQEAIVKSYDSDGFTLTWTKGSSPTGTLSLIFLCFR